MSVSLNTGTVTANISGSVQTGMPAGATIVSRCVTTGNATTDAYTVTAGKTLYITNAWVSIFCTAASGTVGMQADVLGDANYRQLVVCGAGSTTAGVGVSSSNSVSFPIPIQVPATKKVQTVATQSAGVPIVWGGFSGYEL